MLLGVHGDRARSAGDWLLLTPIAPERASYSPLIVLAVIVGVVLLTFDLVHRLYHGRVRRAPAVGLRLPGADAAHAGHRRGLRPADPADLRAVLPHRAPAARRRSTRRPATRSRPSDHLWHWLYLPIARAAEFAGAAVGRIQQGRISVYLTYSFVTLLALLLFVR